MAGAATPDHHESHRSLLWTAEGSPRLGKVDAIIVPTTRRVAYLREAAAAALFLGCPLVTLHSRKWTSAHAANAYLGRTVDLIAIDLPDPAQLHLPELETSRLLAGTIFEQRSDLSTKRNLALVLSRMFGWERVVFLDDDIRVPYPEDLCKAVGLLDTHAAVGLGIGGFPDNSVVCHAYRAVGGPQDTFIGGGALAVDVTRNRSFFPNIYNDDWFYVLDAGKGLQSVATVGQVLQYRYDPYRTTDRARAEEFGDVLAEGTFWLLDQGKTASDGGLAHWHDFLEKRRRFIEQVLDMVEASVSFEPAEQSRMIAALKGSLGRLERIEPELCVAYMRAWVSDHERWQEYLRGVQPLPGQPREKVLHALSRSIATPLIWCTSGRCSVPQPSYRPGQPRRRSPRRTLPSLMPSDLQLVLMASRLAIPEGAAAVPALAGAASSPSPYPLVAAKVGLVGREGQAEGEGQGGNHSSQQLQL